MLQTLLMLLSALAVDSGAQSAVRLPLDGYYRPGRCMPVIIESGDKAMMLSGDDVIRVKVEAGRADRIAPVLVLNASASKLRVDDREIPLHALSPNERIIGCTVSTEAARTLMSELFPGQTIIPIKLDDAQPLSGSAMAWETLDAVVVDHPMDSTLLRKFIASGTAVAVRSQDRPDKDWPWRQTGDYWVLKTNIAGPTGAIGGEAAYLPLQAWQVEQPEFFRSNIVLVGVITILLMLATLLIRSRKISIMVMIVVALLCSGSFAVWREVRQAYQVQVGVIEVLKEGIQQNDIWQYLATDASGAAVQSEIEDKPILLDVNHAAFLHLAIEVRADGSLHWSYQLPPYARLALLNRIIWTTIEPQNLSSTTESLLRDMAKQSYLTKGTRILGEHDPIQKFIPPHWPTVVVGEE